MSERAEGKRRSEGGLEQVEEGQRGTQEKEEEVKDDERFGKGR